MNKSYHLKKYFVMVSFDSTYALPYCDYTDFFKVTAFNKNHVKELINSYYSGVYRQIESITIHNRFLVNLWDKLTNKIPVRPSCEHI